MPRFRFTIRRLMIAVAIVGIVTALVIRNRLASHDRYKSAVYSMSAEKFHWLRIDASDFQEIDVRYLKMREAAILDARKNCEAYEASPLSLRETEESRRSGVAMLRNQIDRFEAKAAEIRSEIALRSRRIKYFEMMEQKYKFASQHPRRAVAPDPPEPK